jgi:hypothetical protein
MHVVDDSITTVGPPPAAVEARGKLTAAVLGAMLGARERHGA